MVPHKVKLGGAAVAIAVLSFTAATIAQPRYGEIDRAEGSLQAALGELQHARNVFGGHKNTAERLIQQALGELQAGKGFAAAHGQ